METEEKKKDFHHIQKFTPIVHEKKIISNRNLVFAVLIGVIVILIQFSFVFFFKLNLSDSLIIGLVLVLFYGILLIFLVEPRVIREIHNLEVKTIEKTIEKPVVREIMKPVMPAEPLVPREIIRTVERPVYIETPRAKLDIPKYDYVGSSEALTYHTRNCRLGKLIKKKYKVSSNNISDFKRKGFSPCKVCILKKKKI